MRLCQKRHSFCSVTRLAVDLSNWEDGSSLERAAMACLEGLNVHFPTSSLKVFAFLAGVNARNLCVVILPWLRKKRLIPR